MKKRIQKLIDGFKPEFGNANHIRACEIIAGLRRIDALKAKKKTVIADVNEEIANLTIDEKQLEFLLK